MKNFQAVRSKSSMVRLTQFTLMLASVLPVSAAGELGLVGEVRDQSFPFAGVEGETLLLQTGDGRIPAPRSVVWRLEGDLRAQSNHVRWAPPYTIGRNLRSDRASDPDKPLKAEVSFVHWSPSEREHNPEPSPFLRDWPAGTPSGGVAIAVWVVDGMVTDTLVAALPSTGMRNAEFSIGFRFPLTPEHARGQAACLLWSEGGFIASEPHFDDPTLQNALIATLFDETERLEEVTRTAVATPSRDGLTLTHYAAAAGSAEAINHFAELDRRVVRHSDENNTTALHQAARLGRRTAVQALISARASVRAATRHRDTPLSQAAFFGHGDIVAELLAARAMPRNKSARTYLVRSAIDTGYVDIVEALLTAGADYDFDSSFAARALIDQAKSGHLEMVRWLVDHGVDVNFQDGGQFALFAAASKGDAEVARALLDAGANPNQTKANGFSPLMAAAESGNVAFAAELLAAGVDPNARLESGATALHIAALADAVEIVRLLLDAGADLSAYNNQDLTGLDAALLSGAGNAAALLAKRGARIDLGSSHSQKLLEAALRWDIPEPLAAALKEGWPVHSAFAGVWPALRLARLFGAEKCEALLVEAGATVDSDQPMPVVPADELDERLRIARAVMPKDPRAADESFPECDVRLEIIVDGEGRPLFPKVIETDDPRLASAAQEVVPRWRFSPPRRHGQPVATQVVLPLNFPPSSERVFEIDQLSEHPVPISRSAPVYPIALKQARMEGSVELTFVVLPDGSVADIRATFATDARFIDAAVKAVSQWRFEPGKVGGRPVATRVRQSLEFSIN